jgi:hypothetical protein
MKKDPSDPNAALDVPEIEPHALFLPESEDEPLIGPPTLAWISITRTRPWTENAGRVFSQADLPDADAVRARFGGGTFNVWGRDAKKRVIVRRELVLHGKPKPMDESIVEDDADPRKVPHALLDKAERGNEIAEAIKAMADSTRQSGENMIRMFSEMRAADREQSNTLIKAMSDHYRAMNEVKVQTVAATVPSTPSDEFRGGMEFMQTMYETMQEKLAPKKDELAEQGGLGEEVKSIGEIFKMLQGMGGGSSGTPAPNGGAT